MRVVYTPVEVTPMFASLDDPAPMTRGIESAINTWRSLSADDRARALLAVEREIERGGPSAKGLRAVRGILEESLVSRAPDLAPLG